MLRANEVGQFFELRLSALKEEGQPKLATLFAFGCEPVTIWPLERFSQWLQYHRSSRLRRPFE
jgi:hypothetical protein